MDTIEITNERKKVLSDFLKKYKLKFKNFNLLNQAFIHSSYTNENNLSSFLSYEKLEFFGDAVLKLVISECLYENYPDFNEGELTKLRAEIVSDKNISKYARKLNFNDLIILGKNEKKQGGNLKESILACAFEALLGAIYVENKEKGFNYAKKFLKENFLDDILSFDKKINLLNPKAMLQEYTQDINHKLPVYKLIKEEGLEHDKVFYVEVYFNNEMIGKSEGKSIKKAEQKAALDALKKLKIIESDVDFDE